MPSRRDRPDHRSGFMTISTLFRLFLVVETIGVFLVVSLVIFGPSGTRSGSKPATVLAEAGAFSQTTSSGGGGGPSSTATPDPSTVVVGGGFSALPQPDLQTGPIEPTSVVPSVASAPALASALNGETPTPSAASSSPSGLSAPAPSDSLNSDVAGSSGSSGGGSQSLSGTTALPSQQAEPASVPTAAIETPILPIASPTRMPIPYSTSTPGSEGATRTPTPERPQPTATPRRGERPGSGG